MDDNELTELLELADGERLLPDGVEDALREQVLATYRRSRATPAAARLDGESPALVIPMDREEERRSRVRRRGPVGGGRRGVVRAVAVGFVAAVVIALVVLPRSEDSSPPPVQNPPSVPGPEAPRPSPTVPLESLGTGELCELVEAGLRETSLRGALAVDESPALRDADRDALERLAGAIEELAARDGTSVADGEALSEIVRGIDNVVLEFDRGSPSSTRSALVEARARVTASGAALASRCDGG